MSERSNSIHEFHPDITPTTTDAATDSATSAAAPSKMSPPQRPKLSHHNTTPDLQQVHPDTANDIKPSKSTSQADAAAPPVVSLYTQDGRPRSGYFSSSTLDSNDDLLTRLEARQSDHYRRIKFRIPKHADHAPTTKKNYNKRVSFDTINIQYSDDLDDDYDNDDSDSYDPYAGSHRGRNPNVDDFFSGPFTGRYNPTSERGRSRSPNPIGAAGRSPMASPSASPNRRILSPMRNDMSRFLNPYRVDYPTRPIITHRGCTFTKLHRDFENLYLRKLYNQENAWLKPVLPHRVILVYISGRKHTWVALDWILRNFIEHGDSVIVVSAINHDLSSRRRLSSNFQSPQRVVAKTPRMRLRQRNRPEYIKFIAKNIMTYIMEVINKDVIAKVSVEIAEGKSKDVLKEMYKLYEPNLVSTGTKPNLRISAPLKSWLSSKLTDRLVKNFPLPVIVVPAMNMNYFEDDLQKEINSRYAQITEMSQTDSSGSNSNTWSEPMSSSDATNDNSVDSKLKDQIQPPTAPTGSVPEDDDTSSINSDESLSSNSSQDSYSSYVEISNLYKNYQEELHQSLENCKQQALGEEYFANFVRNISDKSIKFCQEVRVVDPDFRGRGSKLARAITGSNAFAKIPYKTKSLLQPLEHAKSTSTAAAPASSSSSGQPAMSYKEMKRNLRMNAAKAHQQTNTTSPSPGVGSPPPPTINVKEHSPTGSEGPRKTSLKFVDLQSPSKDTNNNTGSPIMGYGNGSSDRIDGRARNDSLSSLNRIMSNKESKKQSKEDKKQSKRSKLLKKSLSHDIDSSATRPKLEPLKSHPDMTTMLNNSNSNSGDEANQDKKKKKKSRFWKLFK